MKTEASAEQIMTKYTRKAKIEQMWNDGKCVKEICAHFNLVRLPKEVSIRQLKIKKMRNKMAKMGLIASKL